MEKNIREGRRMRTRIEVVLCVQAVMGKNKLLFQFKYGIKKEMIYCSLVYLCSKEEVDTYEPISNLPEKEQG